MNFKIKQAKDMSIEELIGQVIMIGLPFDYLDKEYKEFIKEYKIGNYILFARNYTDSKQMKTFMDELYTYTSSIVNSFPLVSIDQEGGMVVRLFKDVTFPASPLATSATSVSNAPYITGEIIGKDMLKHGVNLNLAPCLEINENLAYPLVNVRGYGATKEIVLKNATSFVEGLQCSGVLSCIKHFPGDGSSTKDSHLELPIIDESKEQLLNYNMYPFKHLTKSDALMTSHCIYKSFDEMPSTLSKVLLTDVLRNEMRFDGLIISDGMEMNAIKDYYGIAEGSVMALKAGCDILLLCHNYEDQKLALESVMKAYKEGIITRSLLEDKVNRINKAKEKVLLGLEKYFTSDIYKVVEEEHNLMQDIVDNSYTLIKGTPPYINNNTLVISSSAKVGSIVEDEFDERNLTNALKHNFPNNKVLKFEKNDLFKEEVYKVIDNYDHILIYSYDAYCDETQKEVINTILQLDKEVHVVSIKGPIDMNHFINLTNYSCLYEYTPNSIKTIIKQLKTNMTLNGKLPL